MKAVIQFTKLGPAKYLSHLDLMRAVQRMLRRSGLPIVYSSGFNPHPRLSFATASPVGLSSLYEVMEVPMAWDISPAQVLSDLKAVAPPGIAPVRCAAAPDNAPAPMAAVEAARYEVRAHGDLEAPTAFFLGGTACVVKKRSKSGERDVDIRPMVLALTCVAKDDMSTLDMTLEHKGEGALRPELVLEGLGLVAGSKEPRVATAITRTALYKGRQHLMDYYEGLPWS